MLVTSFSRPERPRAENDSASWTLVREGRVLSCAIFRLDDHHYLFQVVPVWHADVTIAETFDTLPAAALRSAEFSQQMRNCGWLLSSRMGLPAVV
jgi:hypothetical protein